MSEEYGYGLWFLVVVNSVIFIAFAVSFFHPRSQRDWRVLGTFSAFVVALFTEMYGYPLTVYLLTGPLAGVVPGVDLSHNSGHLWTDLIGWKGDPHVSPFHLASYVFIFGGFWLIYAGWKVLFAAIKAGGPGTAIGLSEDTDAVAIVVSEETGTISLVEDGRIRRGLDGPSLRQALRESLGLHERALAAAEPAPASEVRK